VAQDGAGNEGSAEVEATVSVDEQPPAELPTGGWGVEPGGIGSQCTDNADCESGVCAADTAVDHKYCTRRCDPTRSSTCPAAAECLPSGQEAHFCAPSADGAGNALEAEELIGGCAVAQTGASGQSLPVGLVLLALIAFRPRA
jgi:hypothetical protein